MGTTLVIFHFLIFVVRTISRFEASSSETLTGWDPVPRLKPLGVHSYSGHGADTVLKVPPGLRIRLKDLFYFSGGLSSHDYDWFIVRRDHTLQQLGKFRVRTTSPVSVDPCVMNFLRGVELNSGDALLLRSHESGAHNEIQFGWCLEVQESAS